ncbi:ribosomal protein S15 [Exophiala spinifera]|uniref:Ribosomal protein S15 n=1 Tax=Exophiala spinifera TaxID=91928 RepID=A0A0D1ZI35_9EURO|nr:ribosomal protein S15 [Exophiala spinifera]KIW12527.1 ribosomal protein S15 [Exophiala spinifera]
MPPRALPAGVSSVFNLTSLLQSLPAASRNQVFTKCSTCLFSTTAPLDAKRAKKRKVRKHKHIDPYRVAQARQRKSANLARQKVLEEERRLALGDPIRSRPTPFVNSLRARGPLQTLKGDYLNYFLKKDDVDKSLEYSRWLTEPLPQENAIPGQAEEFQKKIQEHVASHENASKALLAIADLENSSSKDRLRINIQRCIEEFGRHNTDSVIPPKPQSLHSKAPSTLKRRVGADTGSPEVQIAIMTAKINVLADNLHHNDKNNKRGLRLLVHKRQKLMAYLRREDRGGPRWQNVVDKLGLNDAMWKGEISLP